MGDVLLIQQELKERPATTRHCGPRLPATVELGLVHGHAFFETVSRGTVLPSGATGAVTWVRR